MEVKSQLTNNTQRNTTKSGVRINPFRRIAKTARINLNRYWALLSKLNRHGANGQETDIEVMFAAEMEQNRINELLEERARLSSSNSLSSGYRLEEPEFYGHGLLTNQWESDIYGRGPLLSFHHDTVTPSPPPPMRRIRIAKRSLYSPTFSSTTSSLSNYDSCGSNDSIFI